MNTDFDFGFSAVTEEELEAVQRLAEKARALHEQNITVATAIQTAEVRLANLQAAINALLDNLIKDPEKPYIYWPDRAEKVEAFRAKINSL